MSDELFWAKVDTSGECWTWQGSSLPLGYGVVHRRALSSTPLLAHRYSWVLSNGPVPDGMFVCHRCDNPPCVRPDHLFLGSAADNNADRDAKGRGVAPPVRAGLEHHLASVSDEQVREARDSYAQRREFQYEIAARLGVCQTVVSSWVRGETRTDAGGPTVAPRKRSTQTEIAARRVS